MNVGSRLFPLVEEMLDVTAKRQQVLSSNLANIDTPDYQAKDLSFSSQMNSLRMETTSPGHMSITDDSNTRVYEVGGLAKKDNGNTVSLDREMTELSKNGLQYVALVQYVSQKLKTLRTAVTDGGK
jgi:flagellar basal-body rod protein FlgB